MVNSTRDTTDGAGSNATRATVTRRRFLAGAGAVGAVGLAGCTGGGNASDGNASDGNASGGTDTDGGAKTGSSGSGGKAVTILLTPENPTEVKKDYMPMKKYLEDAIDGLEITYRVPLDYAAILPALKAEQAEMGMDDITLIAAPDQMDVMGTAVTGGTAFYYSLMMTKPGSGIDEPADVEGKEMAFADPLSTSGSIYALYELKNAGLDIGKAPGSDAGADFSGTWSNHKAAIEQLINDKADACSTWGGNGMAYVPKGDIPADVTQKSAYVSEAGTKDPELDVFLWSEPIPKQPIYARKTWTDPVKEEIREALLASNAETMAKYKGDDYEGTMPFTTLKDTTIEHYRPVIDRVHTLGIDLTQES
ncbi:PhnD/SsuA/transferrin family substrate-binding protein [Halomarina pelagica]|uniref:PhnD/SsuA/transferrin family substrate-binding protein n=1 Tax=Halomarina pelagica TaxID=2961599 RepID=UPI0020C3681C|nr:PhnD/SsuA/transferrin family substrate-binding protein [Halomarina sp. BND7]